MATRIDLINKMNEHLDYLALEDINYSVDLILEYLQQELVKHNRIEIRGFGSFSIRERKFSCHSDKKKESYKTIYYRGSKTKKS